MWPFQTIIPLNENSLEFSLTQKIKIFFKSKNDSELCRYHHVKFFSKVYTIIKKNLFYYLYVGPIQKK